MKSRKLPSSVGSLLLLGLVPLLLALGAARAIPVSSPEGDFLLNATDAVRTGHVSSTFTPDTYPFLAGRLYRVGGYKLLVVAQALLYWMIPVAAFCLVRRWAVGRGAAILGVLALALDPDLLSSIPKLWDTELTCLLLLGITMLCVSMAERQSWWRLALLSSLWGFSVSVRPNLALLLLPIVYVLWGTRGRFWMSEAAAVGAWALLVYAGMNTLAHGSFYIAQNGPYNLYAGSNAHSGYALLHSFNGESSVIPALAALGVHVDQVHQYDPGLSPLFTRESLLFILYHPVQWVGLVSIKLLTLLRPDTKAHAMGTPLWALKVATSVCVPLWLIVMATVRRLERQDRIVLAVVASYILPFLLTNADPRFRVPLDVVVLAHAVALLARRFAPQIDPVREQGRREVYGAHIEAGRPSTAGLQIN